MPAFPSFFLLQYVFFLLTLVLCSFYLQLIFDVFSRDIFLSFILFWTGLCAVYIILVIEIFHDELKTSENHETPDYTLYSGVHVCWSEHSDLPFVYGFMSLDYGLGTITTITFHASAWPPLFRNWKLKCSWKDSTNCPLMALFRCLIVLHLDSVGGCINSKAITLKRITSTLYALYTFYAFSNQL